MWERWRRILVLAAGLFAITVVARLVSRWWAEDNLSRQDKLAWVAYGLVALTLAVVAYFWARPRPMLQVGLDIAGAALLGCLLSVLVGPYISGGAPFKSGAGNFFATIWVYAGIALGGTLIGLLVVTAAGLDYRSQALKRFAATERARPHRPVRR